MAAKNKQKLTVFLSHSHADIDEVRKVRDVLETLNCEPITFFLACMDDNNPLLEDLIQQEIDARHVFVYCRSPNAEKSKWVKKELEYIRNSGKKRVYEIDLVEAFESSIVKLLNELMKIIYSNTVVLCCAKSAKSVALPLKEQLAERGFATLDFDPVRKRAWSEKVEHYCSSGIFVPIIYKAQRLSDKDYEETLAALHFAKQNSEAYVFPVYVDAQCTERYIQYSRDGCFLSESMLSEGVHQIVEEIEKISEKAGIPGWFPEE